MKVSPSLSNTVLKVKDCNFKPLFNTNMIMDVNVASKVLIQII